MFDAVVLGSGVLGLSAARELHDRGFKVAVVARDLPEDSNSIGFASPWAGCNWYSFAEKEDSPEAQWDIVTFKKLAQLAKEHPELCQKIPFFNVWEKPRGEGSEAWYKNLVFDYKNLVGTPQSPLPGNKPYGCSFKSYVLHAPAYVKYLGAELRARGVPIIRHRLSSLDEAYNLPGIGAVSLVVNATGLGAQTLIGVEDKDVYPARGQTVLVKVPGFKACVMHTEGFNAPPTKPGDKPPAPPAYIIPRPGSEEHVVLGGTYIKNDFSSLPDLEEAQRILKDCYNLVPALAGPNGKSWKDIEVVAHNVGLRPAREGGARLEIEERELGTGDSRGYLVAPKVTAAGGRRKVAVVHAYGIGGAGFQASLGIAEQVSDLAVGYLQSHSGKAKL